MRHRGVTMKLNPLREVVRGKRLTVVDDSIVRGTTTKQIVALLRTAGAEEVHVRISAPPIYHPCFYGIDTQVETELIASTHSVEEIRDFIGADSLGYLSIRGVLAALDLPYDRFCFACFDGDYPEPVPYDAASRKFLLEERSRSWRRAVAETRPAYTAAGVDVAAGERAVDLMRAAVEATRRPEVLGGLGGLRRRRSRSRPATASRCSSRRPTASARRPRSPPRSAATTRSAATSSRCAPTTSSAAAPSRCSSSTTSRSGGSTRSRSPSSSAASPPAAGDAGCALVGGETAEHPGLMQPGRVRPRRLLRRRRRARRAASTGRAVRAGDAILGLPSSGLHANGYSLVRSLVAELGPRPRRGRTRSSSTGRSATRGGRRRDRGRAASTRSRRSARCS